MNATTPDSARAPRIVVWFRQKAPLEDYRNAVKRHWPGGSTVECHDEAEFRKELSERASLLVVACHGWQESGLSDGGPCIAFEDTSITLDCEALLVLACYQTVAARAWWKNAAGNGVLVASNRGLVEYAAGSNFAAAAAAVSATTREELVRVRTEIATRNKTLRDEENGGRGGWQFD